MIAPFPPATHAPSVHVRRWHGSAWLFWRSAASGGRSLASQGRLGGSQAGVRIDRHLLTSPLGAVAGYARASAALEAPHQGELAAGLVLRPSTTLPLGIGIERRIAVQDGGRNAFAAIVTTGIGPKTIGPDLTITGYAQGGIVGAHSRDAFIDGRIALTRPVADTGIALGLSLSGGAQPHVSRLDIGPSAGVRLPIGPARPRLILEWRERIAGNALPGSGPALTLAADF